MSKIHLQDPTNFSETFLDEYCKNGLGSGFSKRDVDVLVFFLLLQDKRYTLPEDIFKACRELKLSETKVRRLYQDAQLRYMQYDEEEAKKRFVAVVESGAIEKKGDKLTFTIREPLLRQYFEEWVAKEKGFTDTSFNKNLVTLSTNTFYKVLDHLANPDMPMDKIKHQLEKEGKFEKDILKDANDRQSLLRLFSEEFAKSAGREAGALSIKAAAKALGLMILGH
jgi:hypothetical protein